VGYELDAQLGANTVLFTPDPGDSCFCWRPQWQQCRLD